MGGISGEEWDDEDVCGEGMGNADGNVLEEEQMDCGARGERNGGAGVRKEVWIEKLWDEAINSIGGGVECGENERQGGKRGHKWDDEDKDG